MSDNQLFNTGQVVMTQSVNALIGENVLGSLAVASLVSRHSRGDFGDVCAEDAEVNTRAISQNFGRVMSSYRLEGVTIWISTDGLHLEGQTVGRTVYPVTTVLLPSDY